MRKKGEGVPATRENPSIGVGCRSVSAQGALGAKAAPGGGASKRADDAYAKEGQVRAVGAKPFSSDKVVWNACHANCGNRCPLKLYVKDGVIVRVEGDDEGSDGFGPGRVFQLRPCVRGRTARRLVHNETRLRKPLRRVAGTKRGQGVYEEISWEVAIREIAGIMKGIKEEYGNDAFYLQYGTGRMDGVVAKSWPPDGTVFARMMNCWGGYLRHYGTYSASQISRELPLLNGDAHANNEAADLVNSKNIVLFGNNPAKTRMSGSGMMHLVTQVRLRNPKVNIVVVDPHLSDTVVGAATTWVPIRPGTDAALVAGMVQYLHANGMLDEAFIRERFIGFYSDTFLEDVKQGEPASNVFFGFDKEGALAVEEDLSYEAYLNGTGAYEGSGPKTPEWAAAITGVPAGTIRALAELYVNGPTATIQGWGPQRHFNGGNSARAIGLIAAITGNVGISGGGSGAREAVGGVACNVPTGLDCFPEKNTVRTCIPFFGWFRAIEDYRSMNDATWGIRRYDDEGNLLLAETPGEISLKAPVKFIWNYGSNVMMGQHADINDCLRIYNLPDEKDSGLRCVVTCDVYLTPTAMVSDYILPGTTSFEETDVVQGGAAWAGFVLCESPAIDPLFECKPVYEICSLLAEELGVAEEFTEGKSQEDWVRWCYEKGKNAGEDLPDSFEEFKETGLFKRADCHEPQVHAPKALPTPSGKYEVFSKQAYNISKQWDLTAAGFVPEDGLDQITPCPVWYESFEGYGDAETRKGYPFQLIGHHAKTRTHSSYGNVDWLESVAPQQCWINARDAAGLGVENGDEVIVSTKRGRVKIAAKVTERIMPGVVSIPQGAWYSPESRDVGKLGSVDNLDLGGCISVLTSQRPTAISKGNGVHSNLCRIEKVQGAGRTARDARRKGGES